MHAANRHQTGGRSEPLRPPCFDGVQAAERDAAHAAYFAGWEHLQRVCAPVVIAGPGELGERAEALKSQLGALGDECDRWYAAHKNGPVLSRVSKFSDAQHAAYQARAAFISVAQTHCAVPEPRVWP
jgi:hypothetical protein